MATHSIKDLCIAAIDALNEERLGFGKTRLVKIVYLLELFYYRRHRKRLTTAEWLYHYYGPYSREFDTVFAATEFNIDDDDRFVKISVEDFTVRPALDGEVSSMLRMVVKRFGGLRLQELLDYVYYDTEPMINVERRGERIDFSTAEVEDYFKIRTLTLNDDVKRRIKRKFQRMRKNEPV